MRARQGKKDASRKKSGQVDEGLRDDGPLVPQPKTRRGPIMRPGEVWFQEDIIHDFGMAPKTFTANVRAGKIKPLATGTRGIVFMSDDVIALWRAGRGKPAK